MVILSDIKKMLGCPQSDAFDSDIQSHINASFMELYQMGIGSNRAFYLETGNEEWTHFSEDKALIESVKTYIYIRVKLVFDPPASSTVLESLQRTAERLEWRLNFEYDRIKREEEGE